MLVAFAPVLQVPANAKEVTMEVLAIRCGCGAPDSHQGRVCPYPRPVDKKRDRRLLYWHRNPLRRIWFALTSAWR